MRGRGMPMAVQADAIPERRLPGWYTIPAGGWMSHTRKILASQVLRAVDAESTSSSSKKYGKRELAARERARRASDEKTSSARRTRA